jgi:hypothetical protein
MKKTTIATIANYIKNVPELSEEYAELAAEIAKGEEKAQANRDLYAAAKDVVLSVLTSTPMTVADIFAACEADLPEGFTKSKIQYALANYWTSEVVKIANPKGPNEYRKA